MSAVPRSSICFIGAPVLRVRSRGDRYVVKMASTSSTPLAIPPEDRARPMKGKGTSILWFRNDLRVDDNATLKTANSGAEIVPLYVFDPRQFGPKSAQMWGFEKTGSYRAQFLIESVEVLKKRLRERKSDLLIRIGKPEEIIPELARQLHTDSTPVTVFATKEMAWEEANVEQRVKEKLQQVKANDSSSPKLKFCWENTMHHVDDLPFNPMIDTPRVFTDYRKLVEGRSSVRQELSTPKEMKSFPSGMSVNEGNPIPSLQELGVKELPPKDQRAVLDFRGGEEAALARVDEWMWKKDLLRRYKELRNDSGYGDFSSKLSPWLALGCISPRTVYWNIQKYEQERVADQNTYWLVFELITRDFFHWTGVKEGTRLFAWNGYASNSSKITNQGRDSRQNRGNENRGRESSMPKAQFWKQKATPDEEQRLQRWIDGQTGVPFVDAAMRELKATGYMSNRMRQNVASFLIHDLSFPDWRAGAEYFEEVLLDHDVASNYGNWAYIAGVGSDPRGGRQFNVIKQARDYDADAKFTKLWCPELKKVPANECHEVYNLRPADLQRYEVTIGENYPGPIVRMRGQPGGGGSGSNRGGGNRGRGNGRDRPGSNRGQKSGRSGGRNNGY